MDISGGVTNIDEYVNLLFTDFCALDKASCADISEVKIVIIEEDEEEAMREAELGIKAAAEQKAAEENGTTTEASATEEVILQFKLPPLTQNLNQTYDNVKQITHKSVIIISSSHFLHLSCTSNHSGIWLVNRNGCEQQIGKASQEETARRSQKNRI